MFNSSLYPLTTILLTRLAEAYDAGAYGSGDYSQADADATTNAPAAPQQTGSPAAKPQQTSSLDTAPQANDTPSTSDNTPVRPSDTHSYQTTSPLTPHTESAAPTDSDPAWSIIIGVGISAVILIGLVVLLAKKIFRQ